MDRIDDWIYGIGPMTGANMLAVATAVLNTGLLTENATTAQFAVDHFYNQTLIVPATGADGVKVDGSYLQHIAQLYTGNYGKDFTKSVIALYQQTRDTAFSAPEASQTAFQTLMDGTQWMIVSNSTRGDVSSSLLWEYSAIGRMVSFVYKDGQASGGVAINFTQLADSTSDWKNSSFFKDLSTSMLNPSDKDANQGDLIGTRAFYSSDYLVHRGDGYVTTLKMFSKRTTNSECNNDQNPFGFHLSDGVIYSYIQGGEYIDVFGEWDWNLAPGSTVDYGNTAFGCNITQWYGNTTFVGSVTANGDTTAKSGNGGLAVMQYLNPMTGDLQWEKTYFFFPGLYAVQIGPISSKSSSPVITTLDQSNLKGDVYINGVKTTQDVTTTNTVKASQIWHNNILYTIPEGNNLTLTVNTTAHPDNDWAKLGISTGTATQRLFQATLTHPELDVKNTKKNDIKLNSYIAQLNTDAKSTSSNDTDSLIQLATQEHPAKVRGAYYVKDKTIALAFWSKGNYKTAWGWTFKTDQPVLLMLSQSKGLVLNVADPTQNLSQVKITVTSTTGKNASYKLTVKLPTDETAGSTVTVKLS
jgi:hypothetical protein